MPKNSNELNAEIKALSNFQEVFLNFTVLRPVELNKQEWEELKKLHLEVFDLAGRYSLFISNIIKKK